MLGVWIEPVMAHVMIALLDRITIVSPFEGSGVQTGSHVKTSRDLSRGKNDP